MDTSVDSFIRVAVNFFFGLYIQEIISFIFFSLVTWNGRVQVKQENFCLS